jgi:hypothetical protein
MMERKWQASQNGRIAIIVAIIAGVFTVVGVIISHYW